MLESWPLPSVNSLREEQEDANIWFEQDEAMCHTGKESIEVLKNAFPSRLLSERGDMGCPL